MIYRWPRTLITKLERAIRNFLWTGNIHKRGAVRVSWERCCAPISEGGLGIRSIRLANESFLCKLAWDLLRNEDPAMSVVHDRYLFDNGTPRNFHRVSSIWTGVRRHFPRLISQSQWLVGTGSLVRFWTDNWLGYRISEKIGLPDELLESLVATVNDFFYDGCWHFEESFFMRYTNKKPTVRGALVRLIAIIRESADIMNGGSLSSAREREILARLKIPERPCSHNRSIQIRWIPPDPGWLKVNIDGSVSPSPGPIYVGGFPFPSPGVFP
ncbi:hypothetical protein ACS0TY_030316 [Phlomoides rotata]